MKLYLNKKQVLHIGEPVFTLREINTFIGHQYKRNEGFHHHWAGDSQVFQ